MSVYHIGCAPSCYMGGADDGSTRLVRITLSSSRLLYDIRNYAYIEGEVMGEGNQHGQHTLVDIGESGNIDRVWRILGAAYAGVVEALYPYTNLDALEDETIGNELWQPGEYYVEMRVPSSFSRTTMHLLAKLIHEYMVSRVMADWLSITNPEKAEAWLAKAAEAKEEIDAVKHLRGSALRRKPSPF